MTANFPLQYKADVLNADDTIDPRTAAYSSMDDKEAAIVK